MVMSADFSQYSVKQFYFWHNSSDSLQCISFHQSVKLALTPHSTSLYAAFSIYCSRNLSLIVTLKIFTPHVSRIKVHAAYKKCVYEQLRASNQRVLRLDAFGGIDLYTSMGKDSGRSGNSTGCSSGWSYCETTGQPG